MRLHRDVKMVAGDLSRFMDMTAQIGNAICDVDLNVLAFAFLQTCRAESGCWE
jgi:hypothetical protein